MVLRFTGVRWYKVTDHLCKTCGTKLMSDEIALHMKLFSRASKEFLCLDCQAAYLSVERGQLEGVIERYHRSGTCVLFAKWED